MSWPPHLSCVESHHTNTTPEEHMGHLFSEEQCGPSLQRIGAQHLPVQQMTTCQLTASFGMTEAGETRGHSLNTCILWFWKVGIIMPFTDGETEAQRDGVTCSRVSVVELRLKINTLLITFLFENIESTLVFSAYSFCKEKMPLW